MNILTKGFLLGFMLNPLFALASNEYTPINASWYASTEFGLSSTPYSEIMTINNGSQAPTPFNLDQYSTTTKRQGLLGFQLGKRFVLDKTMLQALAVGVHYQHLFEKNIKGRVTQYSTPRFNNYAYSWSTDTNMMSLNTKLTIAKVKQIMPYVAAGVGVAINHAGHYMEIANVDVTPRLSPDFNTKNQTQLYYDLGLGIDAQVSNQFVASAGYRYQSIGKMTSGMGQNGWQGSQLHLGRFASHTAIYSLTYIF